MSEIEVAVEETIKRRLSETERALPTPIALDQPVRPAIFIGSGPQFRLSEFGGDLPFTITSGDENGLIRKWVTMFSAPGFRDDWWRSSVRRGDSEELRLALGGNDMKQPSQEEAPLKFARAESNYDPDPSRDAGWLVDTPWLGRQSAVFGVTKEEALTKAEESRVAHVAQLEARILKWRQYKIRATFVEAVTDGK